MNDAVGVLLRIEDPHQDVDLARHALGNGPVLGFVGVDVGRSTSTVVSPRAQPPSTRTLWLMASQSSSSVASAAVSGTTARG